MTKQSTKIKFTYEDYKSLPQSETKQYELLRGDLIMVPSPTEAHQRVSRNLEFLLWQFIKEKELGHLYDAPLDVVFGKGDEREVVQPDIFYIAQNRSKIITEQEIQGPPDLIIEIISSGNEKYDRGYKTTLYSRYGVKEYWLVDPERKMVEVLNLEEKGFQQSGLYGENEKVTSRLLEGLEIDLNQVFTQ